MRGGRKIRVFRKGGGMGIPNCHDCVFYEGDYCPLPICDFKPIKIVGLEEIDFEKPGLFVYGTAGDGPANLP